MKKLLLLLVLPFCLRAQAQTGKDAALESIGALSGLLMYNTYITIGAVADGMSCESYDATYVSDLMDEQISSIGSIIEQMTTLNNSGFLTDASDKDFMKETIATFSLLKNEALYLKKYANKDVDNTDMYEKYRGEAWDKIAELLGLDSDE